MKKIKAFWTWLDGKKTLAASLYWGTVMPGLAIYFPDGIPPDINRPVVVIGFFLTSIGVGHKWWKKNQEAE